MKNYSFQGLRALFAIGVLFSHCYFLMDYTHSRGVFEFFLKRTANVSFFFMISGFFLVDSVMRTSNFNSFIKKKLVKLYPLHIILLVALVAKQLVSGTLDFSALNTIKIVASALLIQTWIPNLEIATAYNTVSWFLSSLLFCYIVGYWVARFILARNEKSWKPIYLITGVLLVYKIIIAFLFPEGDIGYYLSFLCPVAGLTDFLIGVIIWSHIKNAKKANVLLQIVALAAVLGAFVLKNFIPVNFSRAVLMIIVNVLLIYSFAQETQVFKKILGNKFFGFIGNVSFEVYLSHSIIIGALSRVSVFDRISKTTSPFLTLLLLIVICLLFALIYKKAYELAIKIIKELKRKHLGGFQYEKHKN